VVIYSADAEEINNR